jgi:hypothetical protein
LANCQPHTQKLLDWGGKFAFQLLDERFCAASPHFCGWEINRGKHWRHHFSAAFRKQCYDRKIVGDA